ncbi:hypothetical protein [Endozoicomonas sp. 4G]|uniref:hypothetical protein n=1 Tax=Endozoicomonas sp. 4G TaxID=2872754 RepID=UPI00207895CF|nr:hypothetical protein [Endozoicomonas sp. 4G]
MPPIRFANRQILSILLTLLLLLQVPQSFSSESSESCQTGPCADSAGHRLPLVDLLVSAASYFAWSEKPHLPASGNDKSCNIEPFERWKPKLDFEFCQSLIASKNFKTALELLKQTGDMQPATMACKDWQADLADYFNWRWPGNNASQWQQLPVHHGSYQKLMDSMRVDEFMGLLKLLTLSPSVFSLHKIQINDQSFILKGYLNHGLLIAPLLKVAECYFIPEEEPLALGFEEWSGLVEGRMHSLFKAVKGRSLHDWVAESRQPSSKVNLNALFREFGQVLAKFHLRHRASDFDGLDTLSRAVHHDLNFNNVFYDEASGFSLIDTIGLSASVLEPSEVRSDLNRLFEKTVENDISRESKGSFIRAYISQWPEEVQKSLWMEIIPLQIGQENIYKP